MSNGVDGVSSSSYQINALFATTVATSTTNQLSSDPFSDPNGPFSNLNLTAQQQQQIAQLFSQNSDSSSQTPTQLFDQIENVLTPQQQQTLKSDLETLGSHHHHHHGGSGSSDPLSQLDLTSDQQTQIQGILSSAQTNGTSPSSVLSQINGVLTTAQQQQLASLFSAYTATGATPPSSQQPVTINTSA
jgi:Spy/CpxP family protein refolding chaperone